jgi:hypothetical protein
LEAASNENLPHHVEYLLGEDIELQSRKTSYDKDDEGTLQEHQGHGFWSLIELVNVRVSLYSPIHIS